MNVFFRRQPSLNVDFVVNIGSRALLAFLFEENRPHTLGIDTWRGNDDTARHAHAMTRHHYNFTVLAIDRATIEKIGRQDPDGQKLYGIPIYVLDPGGIQYREVDPDGSEVFSDVRRM